MTTMAEGGRSSRTSNKTRPGSGRSDGTSSEGELSSGGSEGGSRINQGFISKKDYTDYFLTMYAKKTCLAVGISKGDGGSYEWRRFYGGKGSGSHAEIQAIDYLKQTIEDGNKYLVEFVINYSPCGPNGMNCAKKLVDYMKEVKEQQDVELRVMFSALYTDHKEALQILLGNEDIGITVRPFNKEDWINVSRAVDEKKYSSSIIDVKTKKDKQETTLQDVITGMKERIETTKKDFDDVKRKFDAAKSPRYDPAKSPHGDTTQAMASMGLNGSEDEQNSDIVDEEKNSAKASSKGTKTKAE